VTLTDGRTLHLSPLHDKVVLVNFWATWCPYCGHEMPSFYRDWYSRGFEILALSTEDNPALIAAYIKKRVIPFPAGIASAEYGWHWGRQHRAQPIHH